MAKCNVQTIIATVATIILFVIILRAIESMLKSSLSSSVLLSLRNHDVSINGKIARTEIHLLPVDKRELLTYNQ